MEKGRDRRYKELQLGQLRAYCAFLRHILLPLQAIWVAAEDQLKPAVEAQIDAPTSRKMFIGVRTLPVAYNPHLIFEAYQRCREIDKELGRTAPGEALIAQNIQAALAAMPFRIGAGGQRVAAQYRPDEEAGVELRAGELIELSLSRRSFSTQAPYRRVKQGTGLLAFYVRSRVRSSARMRRMR